MRMVLPCCSMGGFASSRRIFSAAEIPVQESWARILATTWTLPLPPARTVMFPEPVVTSRSTGPETCRVRSKLPVSAWTWSAQIPRTTKKRAPNFAYFIFPPKTGNVRVRDERAGLLRRNLRQVGAAQALIESGDFLFLYFLPCGEGCAKDWLDVLKCGDGVGRRGGVGTFDHALQCSQCAGQETQARLIGRGPRSGEAAEILGWGRTCGGLDFSRQGFAGRGEFASRRHLRTQRFQLQAEMLGFAGSFGDIRQLAIDLGRQFELLLQILRRSLHARVHFDDQRTGIRVAADCQLYRIVSGDNPRARSFGAAPAKSGHSCGAQIPNEAVHPWLGRKRLRRVNPVHGNIERLGINSRRGIAARITAQQLAAFVENIESDGAGRHGLQKVIQHSTVRRILRGRLFRRKRRAFIRAGTDTESGREFKEKSIRLRDGFFKLTQRRYILENPKRPPVSGDDEIVLVYDEIANGHRGHVELQRLPLVAVVERDKHTGLGASVQQPTSHRILADAVDVTSLGDPRGDALPGFSGVARAVEMAAQVFEAMAIDCRVHRGGVMPRGFQMRDFAPWGEFGRRDR